MRNILVSACLLGVNCRYNGVIKANKNVMELLEREDIHLIPVCPEQLGGLSTPRNPSEIQPTGCILMNDGSFSGTLTEGDGITAGLLIQHAIDVFGESELDQLIELLEDEEVPFTELDLLSIFDEPDVCQKGKRQNGMCHVSNIIMGEI